MYRSPWIRAVAVCGGAALMAGGCASAPKSEQGYLFFPSPPEKPRIQFLTWASGADQVEPGRGALEQFVLGDQPPVQRTINKPYGVAVHDGVVYVCDTKGLCLNRLDFKNNTYEVLGVRGPGRLRKPINIAIDPLGYKFVADAVRNQIVVFGPDDQYIRAFDLPAPCHVVDVAAYGEELYVLDNDETCQIVVLNRTTGEVIRTLGGPGGEPGQFKIPNSLCVSPDGYLYVSDTHNWRIQKLTRDGKPVWSKGTPGYRLGQFGRPRGVRVGPDNIVYVVDGATEIVQVFDADGHILMRFGGPGDMPGGLGLPSTLAVDASSVPYFQKYAHKDFKIEYLLFVISQYGPRLVNVYAFGEFPENYRFSESEIAALPHLPLEEGIGPVEGADMAQDPVQVQNQDSPSGNE